MTPESLKAQARSSSKIINPSDKHNVGLTASDQEVGDIMLDSHGSLERLSGPRSPIPESQARNIDYESERAINMKYYESERAINMKFGKNSKLFSGELFRDIPSINEIYLKTKPN